MAGRWSPATSAYASMTTLDNHEVDEAITPADTEPAPNFVMLDTRREQREPFARDTTTHLEGPNDK